MKKLILISLILAAGLTAYPQSSRSSREAKSSKSKSSQVASRSSSRSSNSKQVKSSSRSSNRSQAAKSRSSAPKSAVKRSSSSRSSSPKSAVKRSSSSRSSSPKSAVKRSSSSRSSGAVRSGSSSSRTSRSSGAVRSGNNSSRSGGAVKSNSSSSRSSRSGVSSSSNRSSQSAARSGSSAKRTSRSSVKSDKNVLQSTNSRSAVPSKVKNSDRGRAQQNAGKSRSGSRDNVAVRTSGSSFNRSNRQGNKTYVRNDGAKFRHQNDAVFTRDRYRTDYRDVRSLRKSRDFVRVHNHYYNWYSHRHVRKVVIHNHFYRPLALDIRRVRYPYRVPVHLDLCWTPHLHQSFVYYYPLHERWDRISYGDYIETASSYEAINYAGDVRRVYGKVEEVYYSPEDRTYTLYFGAPYPYHDFSVVVPRDVAKSFSWSPSWYFEDEHVWVVGLIEMWEGKPEIVLHDEQQIRRY